MENKDMQTEEIIHCKSCQRKYLDILALFLWQDSRGVYHLIALFCHWRWTSDNQRRCYFLSTHKRAISVFTSLHYILKEILQLCVYVRAKPRIISLFCKIFGYAWTKSKSLHVLKCVKIPHHPQTKMTVSLKSITL